MGALFWLSNRSQPLMAQRRESFSKYTKTYQRRGNRPGRSLEGAFAQLAEAGQYAKNMLHKAKRRIKLAQKKTI